ncbi:PHP domain-containing protein [Pseudonocardia sp. WMMC193]|uniref:PHP domain-containing protein n=1 Tax=Pseudonocardia sp. WMMC193 TaxID=2911965 RepID=UPI001F180144|nr:PHP domain-containing protein [Pseudonocardia sp. WMMC193]MCF7551108.1 PHP domain-containing protein [Pseudonocardia sp. WMMC193]
MALIDLHTHSTVSDGTDTPEELVAAAAAAGIDVLALTDHDTTGGWSRAAAVLPAGMRLVRGAEFSCVSPTGRPETPGDRATVSVHLLGYLFDPEHPAIVAEQERLVGERVERLRKMARNVAADYPQLDADRVFDLVPEGTTPGRPHLGQALMRAGVVGSVNEAFAEILKTGSKYYEPKTDTPVERAVQMIVDAGGVPVFAHPLARKRGRVIETSVLADLAKLGLAGVEVDHPDHAPQDRELLRGVAAELGLVATGSSDYHGTNKSTPIAAESTAPDALEDLVDRASGVPVL